MPNPKFNRPPPTRHRSTATLENDRLDDEVRGEAAKAVLDVLRDFVQQRPQTLIKELEQHHIDKIADNAVSAAFACRARQEKAAREMPDDDIDDIGAESVFA